MSTTDILASNDCSFARMDQEQPVRLLPSAPAFPTAGDPPAARVRNGAPHPDARNCMGKFSLLNGSAMGYRDATPVLIAANMDTPGQRLADEVPKRIGHAMCSCVSRPEEIKDANALFVKLGARAV